MGATPTVGRYLYAIPMAIFGIFHFMNGSAMAGMVPVPGGVFWVYLTGLALLAAGVSIMTGKMAGLATTLLGVMLLIFALTIHLPAVMSAADQMAMQASMTNMLKDTALAGGAFALSGLLSSGGTRGGAEAP